MKRIGIFLGVEPKMGGMFQYAQSLLDALASLPGTDYEVHVAYVGAAWWRILGAYRFQIHEIRFGRVGLFMANAFMATRAPLGLARALTSLFSPISWRLRSTSCDLWIFPAQDAIAYQLRLSVVASVHDLMHRYEPHFPEVVKGRRYAIREHRFRNLALTAEAVLVDSEIGRTQVVESYGVAPEKVYPLPYISPLRPDETNRSGESLSGYSLPAKYFFYPAQFWAHKNHAALISAAAVARKRCPDIHLVFTGGSDHEYEAIRAQAVREGMLDRITFAGYVPEALVPEFYRRARAMIMPTFFGPTNIPPLEAISCGCPVAVSNIYAMPEQLGDAALYFDPRSVTEMATVLERLWLDDELCEQLKKNGQRQLQAWGPRQFGERLKTILDAVLDSRKTRVHQ